jgi:hypothetical protein
MKQITLFAIVFASMIYLQNEAQITITSADMPVAGDTVRTSFALNFENFDFSRTGSNETWDFSTLAAASQRLDTFLTVKQTPVLLWPSFFASANVVQKVALGELLPGIQIDNAYQFFNRSTNSFKDFGYGILFSGIPVPLKFSTPDVIYNFPLNMGQTYASTALSELSIPDIGFISIERNRQTEVDGWGSITTPYGTFDVIRLKSIVQEFDSLYADTASQGFKIERNYIEYKWLAKNKKVPVLQCTQDDLLGTTVFYADVYRDLTVGLDSHKEISKLNVFPNPVSQHLSVEFDRLDQETALIRISNTTGQLVYEEVVEKSDTFESRYQLQGDFSAFPNGLYLIEIRQSNKLFQSKFILQH